MNEKDIQQLIERFMAGKSSIEEERLLAEYFRTHDVPEKWQDYKAMFAWFDEGMPHDKDEDNKGNTDGTKADRKQPGNGTAKRAKIITMLTAAAAIALLLVIVMPRNGKKAMTEAVTQHHSQAQIAQATATDSAQTDSVTIEVTKQKTKKKGYRRDRYKVMPPKTYLAKNYEDLSDSIYNKAEQQAKEHINETYREQEELMKSLDKDYERLEQNIDIYLTALENYEVEEEEYY